MLLREKDVAAKLGMSRSTVLKWRRTKGLPYLKIADRTIYYDPGQVRAWLISKCNSDNRDHFIKVMNEIL